ncbi:MAG: glucose-6-phosphate dehydrogenase assembly protein OpcA [Actinomycetota bacterium]|nr:glucose-6-phosphate dehydrogenase assembly protein OpcA [Actinomycetota bacterium]
MAAALSAGPGPTAPLDGGPADDVWSARDTTPDEIDEALRRLLHERHVANDALVPARVLNLVVVADRQWKGETANRLDRVGRYHASRTVLCTVQESRTTLDARAFLHYEQPPSGGVGLIRERIEIDMGPGHLSRLDSIIDPVLVSELPTVLWSPHSYDEAVEALLGTIDVLLIDSDDAIDPFDALERTVTLLESAYVVDLAWLRTTPWRERIAASFDDPDRRAALAEISRVEIEHRPSSAASALLLGGWLASRLGWQPGELRPVDRSGLRGRTRRRGGEVDVELVPVNLEVPGLASVTVHSAGDLCVSLERAPGGLRARERSRAGDEHEWQILGASRGEGGILGEGVRQALLRDPTYGPALAAARGFRAQ